jgi:hypothetical protein
MLARLPQTKSLSRLSVAACPGNEICTVRESRDAQIWWMMELTLTPMLTLMLTLVLRVGEMRGWQISYWMLMRVGVGIDETLLLLLFATDDC